MLTLSIQQPWAWLIVRGFKDIENRSWQTSVRGRILIHAGQILDRDAAEDLWKGVHPVLGCGWTVPVPRDFLRGGIVGEATLTDCVRQHPSDWFIGESNGDRRNFGFVLKDAKPLPFHPCRGALGFFRVEMAPAAVDASHQGSLL